MAVKQTGRPSASSRKNETTPTAPKKREIYVAFSGGGAKAFVHIGALNFLEKNFQIKGVAGTSAGALVAVLKAAGFTSNEMFVPAKGSHGESYIFNRMRKNDKKITSISDLLGGDGLRGVRAAHSAPIIYLIKKASIHQKFILMATLLSLTFGLPLFLVKTLDIKGHYASSALLITASLLLAMVWFYVVVRPILLSASDQIFKNGIAINHAAIQEVERQVALKLGVKGRKVQMGDFKTPIKIIAANLDRQKPKIFSSNGTPSTYLQDALSASICIPVAFKPHIYNGERYIDGGVVSNLPAFVFSEETSLYPERRVVALRITQVSEREQERKRCRILLSKIHKNLLLSEADPGSYSLSTTKDIVQTMFTGAQDLAHSGMNIFAAELPTKLRLLDFDLSWATMRDAYEQGRLFAQKLDGYFAMESIHNSACESIAQSAMEAMNGIPFLKRRGGGLVRVAVAYAPYEGSSTIKLKYSYGFENCSDRDVTLPVSSSNCGKAFTSKETRFEYDNKKIISDLSRFDHISSRINKDIQWILSVPILDKNNDKSRFVINIDSNTKIIDTIQNDPNTTYSIIAMLRNLISLSTLIGTEMRETIDSANEDI